MSLLVGVCCTLVSFQGALMLEVLGSNSTQERNDPLSIAGSRMSVVHSVPVGMSVEKGTEFQDAIHLPSFEKIS